MKKWEKERNSFVKLSKSLESFSNQVLKDAGQSPRKTLLSASANNIGRYILEGIQIKTYSLTNHYLNSAIQVKVSAARGMPKKAHGSVLKGEKKDVLKGTPIEIL